jgi:hypothetical protein
MAAPEGPDTFAGLAPMRRQHLQLRQALEKSIPPLIHSADGHSFAFRLPLHGDRPQVGDLVSLDTDHGRLLGEILSLDIVTMSGMQVEYALADQDTQMGDSKISTKPVIRVVQGEGVILAAADEEYRPAKSGRPFADATVTPASKDEICAYMRALRELGGRLRVGPPRGLQPEDEQLYVDPKGLRRHTLLCGQSGSGKTYSLGVLLEQLLLHTTLKIVVLDPNGDYVKLSELARPDKADDATKGAFAAATAGVRVFSANGEANGAEPLTLSWSDLDRPSVAAMLRLDPIADREEYALVAELIGRVPPDEPLRDAFAALVESGDTVARTVATRVRNLGITSWTIWDPRRSCMAALTDDTRCAVYDIGSLPTAEQRSVVSLAVLESLWRHRERREPVLLVIDEAHNVGPEKPGSHVLSMCSEEVVRIAGEGRKFGLYMLLATQRPMKLHANVVSQCENLILMRMNSRADLEHVSALFSRIPDSLVGRAAGFGLGETLLAGWIVPHPTIARFGGRLSAEGGADVSTAWAKPAG